MRRICVFVFYDFQGIADDYVLYLLDAIVEIVDRIIIVANGYITTETRDKLKGKSKEVYERGNLGFDWGAYKEVFLEYVKLEELKDYDELILMNNSFFGPLYPWSALFDIMNKRLIDFWGITDAKEDIALSGEVMSAHIQGYFIVLRKRVITSDAFIDFWNDLEYPKSFKEAVYEGEVMFSRWLKKAGFSCESYIEVMSDGEYIDNKKNYIYSSDEFIIKHKCPIMKVKAVNPLNYDSFSKAISYIQDDSDYDVKLIYNHIKRKDKYGEVRPYSFEGIKKFCTCHKKIYLYGAGNYANCIVSYIRSIGVEVTGNIVTDVQDKNDMRKVIQVDDYSYNIGDGVIIAVGRRFADDIYEKLISKVAEEDILKPEFGDW